MMSRESKINEGLALPNEKNNYQPLTQLMVGNTTRKVKQLIKSLLLEGHIDDMTAKWLSVTPNSPRIPIFYTLTKIYKKPTPVGRPIISGESKVICSFVSCSFDRFLMCFLCCVVVTHFPFDSLAFFSLTVENRPLLSEYIVCFSSYFL